MIACLTSELHKSNHSRKSKLIQQSLFFFTANRAMNSVQSRFCNRKMRRPLMPHPQDKHSFTKKRAFIPFIFFMLQRSMSGLCARKTFFEFLFIPTSRKVRTSARIRSRKGQALSVSLFSSQKFHHFVTGLYSNSKDDENGSGVAKPIHNHTINSL